MAGFGPMGQPSNPNSLVAALKTQAPAQNPNTPVNRVSPEARQLENLQRIRVSIERAMQFEDHPIMGSMLKAMQGAIEQCMIGLDPQQAVQTLLASLSNPLHGAPGVMGQPSPMQPPQAGAPPMLGQVAASPQGPPAA